MRQDSLTSTYSRLKQELSHNRIGKALGELGVMAQVAGSSWEIVSEIERVRDNYRYLSQYALDGADDPSRGTQYHQIKSEIERLAQNVVRESSIKDSPRMYFSVLRFENSRPDSDLSLMLKLYRSDNSKMSFGIFGGNINPKSSEGGNIRKNLESQAQRIFNKIWVTHPLTSEDVVAVEHALGDETLPLQFKRLLISALLLGVMDYYDEAKLIILARVYHSGNEELRIYAAVALLLSMWKYRHIEPGKQLLSIIDALADTENWNADSYTIFKIFARTRDTERIVRTFNEEVIPDIARMKPDIEKRLGKQTFEEMMEDPNPEWEEMMMKSKIADRLKEMNDLQEDGCDVMMATFSHLKSFPFFNEPSNWFLPFDRSNTAVTSVLGDNDSELSIMIERSMPMCDSDKYSMVMALSSMPESNRRAMLGQFEALGQQNSELLNSMLNPSVVSRERTATFYIQDIFRFYTLFRRKSEFMNPFSSPINLTDVPCLAKSLTDVDKIRPIAEFYFKRKYYQEALDLYGYLESHSACDPLLYQKTGFCYQHSGRCEKALAYYRKSELIMPDSEWTMRKIAFCLRTMGHNKEALEYYRRVEATRPDDVRLAVTIGNVALDAGLTEEALKEYYKADFLGDRTGNALRGLGWGNFLIGDYNKSLVYFDRILSSGNANKNDYLNAGHLMMALGRFRDAADRYILSIHASEMKIDGFEESMNSDRHHLEKAGVDPLMIDIVTDAVISEAPLS